MWNLHHDTSSVACLVTRLSTTVLHVLQYLECIVHQLMAFTAVDIYYHTHTTSIMLIAALVESLVVKFAICHIILTFTFTLFVFGCKVIALCSNNRAFAFFLILQFSSF